MNKPIGNVAVLWICAVFVVPVWSQETGKSGQTGDAQEAGKPAAQQKSPTTKSPTTKLTGENSPNLIRILVIDGQPRTKFFVDETSYLMAFFGVIADKDDVRHRYKVVKLLDLQLTKAAADLIDIVILCNVEKISEGNAKLLHYIVRRGGAVMLFLGNKVDPKNYNERLFRDGKGILPAALTDHVFLKSATPKFLDGKLATMRYPTSSLPVFRRIYGVAKRKDKQVQTVASIDDKPLLLVRHFEKGRCVMFTSTIDTAWNGLARHPLFVVTMLESIRYARGDSIPRKNSGTPDVKKDN